MPLIIGQGVGDARGGNEPYTFVNLLAGATASIDNKISSVVSELVPGFVNNNHSGFVDFMTAYYEWMEQIENPHGTSVSLIDMMDIDKSLDSFITYFKDVYFKDFPKNLAVDTVGNILNEKTIIKNISDFYGSKGTEKSYKFFLRILHDSDVEFYYPKEDMLRVSDGKWIQKKSVKVTSDNGIRNFDLAKTKIEQLDPLGIGEVSATATVESVLQYNVKQYFVTELFLNNINGTFKQGYKIRGYDDDDVEIIEDIYSVPSVINIVTRGAGYRSGDRVEVDINSTDYRSGEGHKATVETVDELGGIRSVKIENFGTNYLSNSVKETIPVVVRSTSGDGHADAIAELSALCIYPGYWLDNDGKLSSNKYMRDNERFHEFSYVLKTETALSNYREQARNNIHPAGTRLFGNISLVNEVSSVLPYHTEIVRMHPPLVGHYTPYTLNTHDNLVGATATDNDNPVNLYPEGFNPGATSANHCLGNTGGRLSIVLTGLLEGVVGYTPGTFQNGMTFEQAAQGVTGMVFAWTRTSNTGGVLFVYTQTNGDELEFEAGSDLIEFKDSGVTGEILSVQMGNGTVYDQHAYTHITGPDGGLDAGASDFNYPGPWPINASFQSASDDISEVISAKALHTTTPYTAGFDYSLGNIVYQEHDDAPDSLGIVVDWIAGVSGEAGSTLVVQQTNDGGNISDGFGGGDNPIYERDNRTGNNTKIWVNGIEENLVYDFAGAWASSNGYRIKIKNTYLDDVVLLPSAGDDTWQFHSGDDEAEVVGGYTGEDAGE